MAPSPPWSDLVPELLCHISDLLDLKSYTAARATCTTWRHALPPQSPTLLIITDEDPAPPLSPLTEPILLSRRHRRRIQNTHHHHHQRPYAFSLRTRRSFSLTAIVAGTRIVGSTTDGWIALSVIASHHHTVFVLLHAIAGVEIVLPPLVYKSHWAAKVSKVVFSPRPTKDDFAAAAICDGDRVAYVTAGARRWAVMDRVVSTGWNGGPRTAQWALLVDIVYDDRQGVVYCLTECGDVYVVRLPERCCRQPAAIVVDEEAAAVPTLDPNFSLLVQPLDIKDRKFYIIRTLGMDNSLRPLRFPNYQSNFQTMRGQRRDYEHALELSVPSELEQPHLNAPATVEPLLSQENLPFNRATAFGPLYDKVSPFAGAKNLVFCEGNLYQVWRNKSCTLTLNLPTGGRLRVAENEVLVFRYYPWRRPCWDVVKDLGGYSFFVGKNSAVSMYAKGVPGLKGNCVYWIGGRGRDQGMVFDMESGKTTPCKAPPPVGSLPGHPHRHSTICWYFLNDICNEHQPLRE